MPDQNDAFLTISILYPLKHNTSHKCPDCRSSIWDETTLTSLSLNWLTCSGLKSEAQKTFARPLHWFAFQFFMIGSVQGGIFSITGFCCPQFVKASIFILSFLFKRQMTYPMIIKWHPFLDRPVFFLRPGIQLMLVLSHTHCRPFLLTHATIASAETPQGISYDRNQQPTIPHTTLLGEFSHSFFTLSPLNHTNPVWR